MAAFAVPTSLDHRAFEHLDDVSTTMTLVLEALVGDQGQPITALALVGASNQPGSMQSLAPGERLVIRVPSKVFRQPAQLLKASGEYRVRARVLMSR